MSEIVIGRRVDTLRILAAANTPLTFRVNLYQRGVTPKTPLDLTGFTFAIRMEDGEEVVGIPNLTEGKVVFSVPGSILQRPIGSRYRGGLFAANGGDEALVFRVVMEIQ